MNGEGERTGVVRQHDMLYFSFTSVKICKSAHAALIYHTEQGSVLQAKLSKLLAEIKTCNRKFLTSLVSSRDLDASTKSTGVSASVDSSADAAGEDFLDTGRERVLMNWCLV